MALLTESHRLDVWAEWMREPIGVLGAMTKHDLRAAVDAMDTWIEANQTSLNQAIPQPARSVLTTRQKAMLFLAVVRRRFEVT